MSFGFWGGDVIDPHEAYCADGCGRLAETERVAGLTSRGVEVVELVCHPCYAATVATVEQSRPCRAFPRLRRTWRRLTSKETR